MVNRLSLLRLALPAVAGALMLAGETRADVITHWNEVLLQTIAAESNPPPLAARNLAMMHAAMYDAVNSVHRTHRPYLIDKVADKGTSDEAAAAQAAYEILIVLYPKRRATFDAELAASLKTVANTAGKKAGIELGKSISRDVLRWRSDDAATIKAEYRPSFVRGKWRPTPPKYAPALLPGWGNLKPFGMDVPSQFRQDAPPSLNTEDYTAAYNEVKALGAAESDARTPDQTEAALFWSDGPGTATPAGHWNRIAQEISRVRRNSLRGNARLFALLNITLADAGIVCWDMKYHYNCWRPVTAIRQGDADGNPETVRSADWLPLLETPAFPSCTSGHSTFSGAAATVLILYYDTDDISFTSMSEEFETGRTYERVSDAAREAGLSRVYGGIHFQFENISGLISGEALARYVLERYLVPLPRSLAPQPKPKPATQPRPGSRNTTQTPTEQPQVAARATPDDSAHVAQDEWHAVPPPAAEAASVPAPAYYPAPIMGVGQLMQVCPP